MNQYILKTIAALIIIATCTAAKQTDAPTPPEGMVYVPAGKFIMGSNVGDADEGPKQTASTGAYFIDKFEVSNAEFKKFDPNYAYRADTDDHAAKVTWIQANAYAESLGKRLPTETEWEKAARGTDGRVFPWGNTYDHSFVVWDRNFGRGSAIARPESPYGCIDMAGGAWEWTASWYKPYKGNKIPCEEYGETHKVIRGGCDFNDMYMLSTTHRYYIPPHMTAGYFVGFRCVKDAT